MSYLSSELNIDFGPIVRGVKRSDLIHNGDYIVFNKFADLKLTGQRWIPQHIIFARKRGQITMFYDPQIGRNIKKLGERGMGVYMAYPIIYK